MYKLLQSQEFMRDPAPALAELREQGALVRAKIPILGRVWFTTTHAAAATVLKDQENFSVKNSDGKAVGLSWWMPKLLTRLTSNMLSSDELEHKRLRGIVDHAFQRRAVAEMGDLIDQLAHKQKEALFWHQNKADLVSNYSRPFPLQVICELLGLPKEDREQFSNWVSGITTVTGVMSFLMAIHRLQPLTRYIENRIAYERANGGAGLIHELVQDSDSDLTDDELMAMVFLLLLAGHETTTHLISGGAHALFEHPDQLTLLRNNPDMLDLAVEELLRFVSPVQMTKPRFVRCDCTVEGVKLVKGELVMPLLVAANFDPEIFDEPDKLDISRKPNRHMEFGTGIHFCLGNQLARLEMKAALKTLFLGDYPIKLAFTPDQLTWHPRIGLRSLKKLMVMQ